jgi:hypothetical protein
VASAARAVPAYEGLYVLVGQVDADGHLLVDGMPIELAPVAALLASTFPDTTDVVALVVSGGSAAAPALADLLGLPVLATSGVLTISRDGRVTAGRSWTLVRPGAEPVEVPLRTLEQARSSVLHAHRSAEPPDIAATPPDLPTDS